MRQDTRLQVRSKEAATRILYRAAFRKDISGSAADTLMEAVFYLNHGRFSPIRSGHPLTRVVFQRINAEAPRA